jgi:hypothetical protein
MQSNRFLQIGMRKNIKILLYVKVKQIVDFVKKKNYMYLSEVIFNKI